MEGLGIPDLQVKGQLLEAAHLTERTTNHRPQIAIVCTGLGRIKRGFETLARDLFDGLTSTGLVDAWLYKGGGRSTGRETVVPNAHRDSLVNRLLCALFGARKRLYFEYLSFCSCLGPLIWLRKPSVIYTLEPSIYKFLIRWRRLTGANFALIHSTSGQLADIPVGEACFIHHCTPCYVNRADSLGFPRDRQFVVPQFIDFETIPPLVTDHARRDLRRELNLPENRPVILSVGSLDKSVKRMHYVIEETANSAATGANPFLVMLGQRDPETPDLQNLADRAFGPGGYVMKTVSRTELWKFYQAADVFVLGSLREGFGFVYVEALASGLRVIAHDYDVSRYVLGEQGTFGNLEVTGTLTRLLADSLRESLSTVQKQDAREYARSRFDWKSLAADYVKMFEVCAESSEVVEKVDWSGA